MVSNQVSHSFAEKVALTGVTVAEWSLMRTLYKRQPTAPSQLAEEMGMTRGAITKLADRLIAKSMIARAENPQDGRAQTLVLTDAGARLVPELATLADQNDAEFFEHLAPEDRQHLKDLLVRIVQRSQITTLPTN
ncbi:MAG: MarR family transcriptional regulator [Mesorhizobium sp.]